MAGKVTKKPDAAAVTVPYEPTAGEKAVLETRRERRRARKLLPARARVSRSLLGATGAPGL